MKHLAAIGLGYTAQALVNRLERFEWRITGSSRTEAGAEALRARNYARDYDWIVLNDETLPAAFADAFEEVTHVLISASPGPAGDPILSRFSEQLADLPDLCWVGYLSTIGVYGHHDGGGVDEETPPNPSSERGRRRVAAETAWQAFGQGHDMVVQIFRLPGIYGPGRSVFDRLEAGTSRRIIKPGQVFNRMHVDDIAGAIEQAMIKLDPKSRVFNLSDDLPAPPQDVIAYAADLMGIEPPPEVSFDEAAMTDMARSFYSENKRVSNDRMKTELGYQPIYPTYREGLQAIWQETF